MDAFIIDAVRTPRGRGKREKGSLSSLHPQELLAQSLNELMRRTGVEKRLVEDLVVGAVSQVNEQGANVARNALLAAQWPQEISAFSLNRFCASGLQAIHVAAMGVMSGAQDLVVAGGVESMSRVPMGSDGAGQDGDNLDLRARIAQVPQGISADLIATRRRYGRANVDGWALESQHRAAAAPSGRGLFPVVDREGRVLLDRDEIPRPTTPEALAKLPPSFAGTDFDAIARRAYPDVSHIEHVHTAGNSSALADGAAAVLVASESFVRAHGLRPRARIRAMATVGSEPVIMLTGPAPASRKALNKARLSPRDVDLWEINEAFAAVVLETVEALEIDPDRVNVNGGAIALGHPLGATGAMLVGSALEALEQRDGELAAVTMCIGGGQGIATVLERV